VGKYDQLHIMTNYPNKNVKAIRLTTSEEWGSQCKTILKMDEYHHFDFTIFVGGMELNSFMQF
jgi:hypothetical protein